MEKLDSLNKYLSQFDKLCVAYSGGVDSDLVMNAAHRVLGENVIAIIGDAAFLARKDLEDAKRLAEKAGVKYYIVQPDVFSVEKIRMNDRKRCYYCKKSIMTEIIKKAAELGFETIADGKNADDGKVYRPGAQAAGELGIVSPLYESGMTKADIRQAAREMGLETWDKASNSCLATRFPYDTELTKDKLDMVEKAELLIADRGIKSGRVRTHGNIARIEVPKNSFEAVISDEELISGIKRLGFSYVTLDLEGFRSGSMD